MESYFGKLSENAVVKEKPNMYDIQKKYGWRVLAKIAKTK